MKISLRAARVNAGYTLQQAADLLGIHIMSIFNYEHGKTAPSVYVAQNLANLYGLDINDIKWEDEKCES